MKDNNSPSQLGLIAKVKMFSDILGGTGWGLADWGSSDWISASHKWFGIISLAQTFNSSEVH